MYSTTTSRSKPVSPRLSLLHPSCQRNHSHAQLELELHSLQGRPHPRSQDWHRCRLCPRSHEHNRLLHHLERKTETQSRSRQSPAGKRLPRMATISISKRYTRDPAGRDGIQSFLRQPSKSATSQQIMEPTDFSRESS